jgi:prephenate dehydratase
MGGRRSAIQVVSPPPSFLLLFAQEDGLSSAIFTVNNDVGSLSHVLAAFQKHGVNLSHIESRPNKGAYVRRFACDWVG